MVKALRADENGLLPDHKVPVRLSASNVDNAITEIVETKDPCLVDKLRTPIVIGHRGAALVYPEHTMESYKAVAEAGFPPEQDIYAISTGELVCIHDSTVDRTMDGSGTVSSLTRSQWEALRVKPLLTGLPKLKGTYWNDVLAEFGGRHVLVPELKDSSGPVTTEIINTITQRNLKRSVLVQSFNYAACVATGNAGLTTLYLSDSVGTGGSNPNFIDLLNNGIEFLGCSTGASQSYIQSAVAAGLKVIVYTVNDPSSYGIRLSWGAHGVFTDDPWKITRNYTPITLRERFDTNHLSPGGLNNANTAFSRLTNSYIDSGLKFEILNHTDTNATTHASAYTLGRFGFGVQYPLKLRFKAQTFTQPGGTGYPGAADRNTSWIAGFYFGTKVTGGPHVEASDEEFLLAVIRSNGVRQMWTRFPANGATTSLGATTSVGGTNYSEQAVDTTSPIAGGVEIEYEIEITGTQAIFRCLTFPTDGGGDLTVSYTPLASALCQITLRFRGRNSVVRDIRIQR